MERATRKKTETKQTKKKQIHPVVFLLISINYHFGHVGKMFCPLYPTVLSSPSLYTHASCIEYFTTIESIFLTVLFFDPHNHETLRLAQKEKKNQIELVVFLLISKISILGCRKNPLPLKSH